jgi:2-polyprenyl-6-methoxyphenol hydroxylase-like FAD-dependent oxidoreductase
MLASSALNTLMFNRRLAAPQRWNCSMTHDVLIAGAGPVGLLLACELRLGGASVLVLERARDPASPLKAPPFGLRGLSIPTCEALDRRDLLEAIAGPKPPRAGGHFAGIPFESDLIDTGRWPWRLPGPAALPAGATMAQIEAALTCRALDLGADIRRGVAVESIEVFGDSVRVLGGGAAYEAAWLVGCDGGRSAVRKTGGFAFSGTEPEFTGYSVQVELADPDALPLGRHYTANGMYFHSEPGVVALVIFDGGVGHRAALTVAEAQALLRTVAGAAVTVTALHQATTWTDRAYQTEEYRRGRVLLAGDAAHIHAPLGGQGLNLGLGDAMNLGWKLAATVRGVAPTGLLDTYGEERRPIGASVLDWSRAQVAVMRPSPSSRALEGVLRDVIATRDGATYFAGRVWGIGQRYPLGAHPLLGMSAPNFELADDTTLGERLRAGKWVLLDFDGVALLQSVGARWIDRMIHVRSDAKDRLGLNALLIRPDGVVAWIAGEPSQSADLAQVEARWLGAEKV